MYGIAVPTRTLRCHVCQRTSILVAVNEDGDISRIIPGFEDIRDILRIWVSHPGIPASLPG